MKRFFVLFLAIGLSAVILHAADLSNFFDMAEKTDLNEGDMFFGYFEDNSQYGLLICFEPAAQKNISAIKVYLKSADMDELIYAAWDKSLTGTDELNNSQTASSTVSDIKSNGIRAKVMLDKKQIKYNDIIRIIYLLEDNSELTEHTVREIKVMSDIVPFAFKTGSRLNNPKSHTFECYCSWGLCKTIQCETVFVTLICNPDYTCDCYCGWKDENPIPKIR